MSSEAAVAFEEFWTVHKEARLEGRNKILGCLCPQIHGMLTVKLATLLMLIGGLRRVGSSGSRVRGEIHMLLIGDPGTGESPSSYRKQPGLAQILALLVLYQNLI